MTHSSSQNPRNLSVLGVGGGIIVRPKGLITYRFSVELSLDVKNSSCDPVRNLYSNITAVDQIFHPLFRRIIVRPKCVGRKCTRIWPLSVISMCINSPIAWAIRMKRTRSIKLLYESRSGPIFVTHYLSISGIKF